jgi:restriction system protein
MMLFMNSPKDWRDLQLLTKQLFEEINCQCEVEQNINTARGKVCVDIHVTDFVSSPPLIYLCECKSWKTKVPKSVVHSFRSIVHDSGANRGYIISKAGF